VLAFVGEIKKGGGVARVRSRMKSTMFNFNAVSRTKFEFSVVGINDA